MERDNNTIHSYDYDESVSIYKDYYFSVNMENEPGISILGYISEKIVDGFLSGAIPIYMGKEVVDRIFNPQSFMRVRLHDNIRAANHIVELLKNKKLRDQMRKQVPVSEESMKKFFSWHPDVWKRFRDDSLRRKIWRSIYSLCNLTAPKI